MSFKKVEMEVMFGGFEDGGWCLVVLGCWRGVRGSPKLAKKHQDQCGEGAGMFEREGREKMAFGLGCIFFY